MEQQGCETLREDSAQICSVSLRPQEGKDPEPQSAFKSWFHLWLLLWWWITGLVSLYPSVFIHEMEEYLPLTAVGNNSSERYQMHSTKMCVVEFASITAIILTIINVSLDYWFLFMTSFLLIFWSSGVLTPPIRHALSFLGIVCRI